MTIGCLQEPISSEKVSQEYKEFPPQEIFVLVYSRECALPVNVTNLARWKP
jgi:hypothetical protein